MKRLLMICMAAIICLSLTACGGNGNETAGISDGTGGTVGSSTGGTSGAAESGSMALLKEDRTEKSFTFLSAEGNTAVYSGYSSMTAFAGGVSLVTRYSSENGEECALITPKEKTIINWGKYDKLSSYYEFEKYDEFLKAKKEGMTGIVRTDGQEIIPCEYDDISREIAQSGLAYTVRGSLGLSRFICTNADVLHVYNQEGVLLYTGEPDEELSYSFNELLGDGVCCLQITREDETIEYIRYSDGKVVYTTSDRYLGATRPGTLLLTDKKVVDAEGKILCFDSEGNIVKEIPCIDSYNTGAFMSTFVGNQYVLFKQNTRSSADDKYTIYDLDWNEVYDTNNSLEAYCNAGGDIAFLEYDKNAETTKLLNSNLEVIKEFPGYKPESFSNYDSDDLMMLFTGRGDATNNQILIDYSGNIVMEGVNCDSYNYRDQTVILACSYAGNSRDTLASRVLVDGETQKVFELDSSFFEVHNPVKWATDKYFILLNSEDTYTVMDRDSGDIIFEVSDDVVEFCYTFQTIIPYFKLSDGYYTITGKKAADL